MPALSDFDLTAAEIEQLVAGAQTHLPPREDADADEQVVLDPPLQSSSL